MSDPNWQRLLRVVAQDLAGRCVISGHAAELGSTWSAFTSNSATGGGTNSDIKSCMTSLFEAIQLGMKDKTILLLTTYAVLKESDLLWSPLTWRLMLVTAIGAAAEKVLVGADGAAAVHGQLARHVAHWAPRGQLDLARHVFIRRQPFVRLDVRDSELLRIYFDLRNRALAMDLSVPEEASVVACGSAQRSVSERALSGRTFSPS